ncbi:hypothetical protein GF359_02005 [candidate division WOR-3 bacterium]|uniref:Uncharacterized protein n=1 Tax=candidate division WOR-3 bacterium TaxID=2052148 RepID=A0A9D5K7X6_UNCW3|nr:hypothetical protein [candidate division WOR-3 bacterium]MBD3363968.1 hypothetical protein [candidate division WOR-3 bacterium]
MNISTDPWVWIAAILTLAIFSLLYRDNPFYRVAEHLFVGLSIGYTIVIMWQNVLWPQAFYPLFVEGDWWVIIPIAIGLLYFARFIPKAGWLVRIPISIALGWGMGVTIPRTFRAQIFKQMEATLVTPEMFSADRLWSITSGGIWAIVILLGTLATLTYFFFSRKEKSPLKPVSNVGIVFIMIGFGATFGLTVMSRVSLLIGRLQFLLKDWLGVIQ